MIKGKVNINIAPIVLLLALLTSCIGSNKKQEKISEKPNIIILLTDQWRADAFGYLGNPDVKTPNIDKLAGEGIQLVNAISGMPVCTPARASILTGQRPLSNGVFMNDVQLDTNAVSLGKVMTTNGYKTGYIGKWHLDGHGRGSFIPQGNRRQGFQYWKALECTHNYNKSYYYADKPDTLLWDGYDAIAQTKDACNYIRENSNSKDPFLLFLSYGPPHAPYQTAPEKYQKMYSAEQISISPNVPEEMREKTKKDFAGYYAHCTALDYMVAEVREALKQSEIEDKTILLFMSDHGDLLGSHGYYKKQQPYNESAKIPMIFYVPPAMGGNPAVKDAMINVEDIMPTLLNFASIDIPETVEGIDYSEYIMGNEDNPGDTVTLISCVQPFGQWSRNRGGQEYRGLISQQYTYARDLNGPWLFFDNTSDPYQMNNLVGNEKYSDLIKEFDNLLTQKLNENKDQFLPGLKYVEMYNYPELDERETVPYTF